MIAIRNKTTKIVPYLFPDGTKVILTDKGMRVGTIKALDINATTHEIISAQDPGYFVGSMLSYDTDWTIVNQERYAEYLVETKATKKKEINILRYSKIYMDAIPYTFPGDTEPDGIQMRDETDRQNIQDFVIDASNKDPDTIMYWMPVSNNVKAMKASEAVAMGQTLKARGDAIMGYSWQLKGQIDAAQTDDEVQAVDITSGWPE